MNKEEQNEYHMNMMKRIIEILKNFKIDTAPHETIVGATVTRYEVLPKSGVRLSKISSLGNDIALALKVSNVRVMLTDRGTIGIEVPNKTRENVCIREMFESDEWKTSQAKLPVALGKDISGKPIILDLAKMPHALIAGSIGSGKSVCINAIIASLVKRFSSKDLRFMMIDPKIVELQQFNSLPHMLTPVITDPRKVPAALEWLTGEMMKRFNIFKKSGVRNIVGFNEKLLKDKETQSASSEDSKIPTTKMPYIVCIINELADLMMVAGKEVEGSIARITQLARAAGIHMLVATQRPSTDVITGLIKANLPTRIAFKVASQIDSRTFLDGKGAESLIGWGDMLFMPPGSSDLVRAQGAFISDDEITDIVEALKVNGEPEFVQEIQDQLDAAKDPYENENKCDEEDDLCGGASSALQRAQICALHQIQIQLEASACAIKAIKFRLGLILIAMLIIAAIAMLGIYANVIQGS